MSRRGKRMPFFLPTQTVYDMLVEAFPNRVNPQCAVYLTAVLEYLTAEVLEIAGKKAKERRSPMITLEDITFAMHNDPELKKAFPVSGEGNSK
ncbi:Histone H2A-beta like protein [Argiope bruennichi]|uniref:Histone H2A-beta like protein n=1 Tax=Argiope bruennichi TaxID=94029 RepID=A0A8T0F9A3_ARGBR|nr:Histone H2A-beta like protein [Argiope bruennichi]